MSAQVYVLADAYADRARDLRCEAYKCNDVGNWTKADALLCAARRLEEANAYARKGIRVVRGSP